MSDLVEQLRTPLPYLGAELFNNERAEAADEIERLEKVVSQMREALSEFVGYYPAGINPNLDAAASKARKALGESK